MTRLDDAIMRADSIVRGAEDKEALARSFGFADKEEFVRWCTDLNNLLFAPNVLDYMGAGANLVEASVYANADLVLVAMLVGREYAEGR